MSTIHRRTLATPLGIVALEASEQGLVALHLDGEHEEDHAVAHPVLDQASAELTAWFAGERTSFSVALAPEGTTFQRSVWRALQLVPFGDTRSYSWLAGAIGKPRAVRAVGAANGRNPLPIFVPCHRIVGADGSLTGYSGGLERKRWLLEHEGHGQLRLL